MSTKIYLSLGSNLGNCKENLALACEEIANIQGLEILAKSKIWRTEPQNNKDQAWFHNQVLSCIVKDITAQKLIDLLLDIEQKLGRQRPSPLFAPRLMDIDILLFGEEKYQSTKLTIPHPRMLERAFVLIPLQEIEYDLIIDNKSLAFYLHQLRYRIEADCIWQS